MRYLQIIIAILFAVNGFSQHEVQLTPDLTTHLLKGWSRTTSSDSTQGYLIRKEANDTIWYNITTKPVYDEPELTQSDCPGIREIKDIDRPTPLAYNSSDTLTPYERDSLKAHVDSINQQRDLEYQRKIRERQEIEELSKKRRKETEFYINTAHSFYARMDQLNTLKIEDFGAITYLSEYKITFSTVISVVNNDAKIYVKFSGTDINIMSFEQLGEIVSSVKVK